MVLLNDISCQICERFITEGQRNRHLYSSRHLHREVNGYWPAYFPQKKLLGDEGMKLEKTFWQMFFGNEVVLSVYGILRAYFMMVTNLNEYVEDDDDDDKDGFGYPYRDNILAHFKQDIYYKSFSLQDRSKGDKNDTFPKKIKLWFKVIDMVVQYLIMFMIIIIPTLE